MPNRRGCSTPGASSPGSPTTTSGWDLWLAYFALGGAALPEELGRYLAGTGPLGDHDVAAHALSERFVDLDLDHPVPYLADG